MKVVGWNEFAALPAGTIYSDWKPCFSLGLYRKGETLYISDDAHSERLFHENVNNTEHGYPHDFVVTDLLPSPQLDGNPQLDNSGGRDGLYEFDRLFCVFDAADVEKLVKMVQNIPTED